LVENLIRAEIHPMEEAQGFRALLDLEDPKYSVEQIAAKVGKTPAFVAQRLKLTDLAPAAVEAFYADSIGVGHALLLAKLPADQQEQALKACFKEVYANGDKTAKIGDCDRKAGGPIGSPAHRSVCSRWIDRCAVGQRRVRN
jgi:ParB family chromosome partitioning protein